MRVTVSCWFVLLLVAGFFRSARANHASKQFKVIPYNLQIFAKVYHCRFETFVVCQCPVMKLAVPHICLDQDRNNLNNFLNLNIVEPRIQVRLRDHLILELNVNSSSQSVITQQRCITCTKDNAWHITWVDLNASVKAFEEQELGRVSEYLKINKMWIVQLVTPSLL